ncbi:hypothetical protein [Nocardioides limicola]|uniref:hypothetical protein n=1 Tax=Nocardioides limicola TaxID=2803368 RepID=UPI00193C0526|nr:hypothetical protein [Nocardioides sp. DJM-14]
MWETTEVGLSGVTHDLPCLGCGHPPHTYYACSESCDCVPPPMPGTPSMLMAG